MTTTRQATGTATGAENMDNYGTSGWTGWIVFAGVMMLMMGAFHVIQGLVALFQDTYYLVGQEGLVVQVDYTTWGWVHTILGAVVILAGIALLAGQMWARVVAIILAFGSALVNIAFLGAYPLWSITMIAIDVLVIYAVTMHGKEMKPMTASQGRASSVEE
ncbi:DUF7144 family membrane protein [Cryobacterium arcticum]|uniref:DUF7144 domain-containing protein n=1 Tax=Cryobacterium arcticum TaxID=670052 RepID=A0A317ZQF3_9MICO|nr:hypothetical protein [Cryobacterium arcticum]PXA67359.1 hypothetical protein CTB96_11490 [Cryobacterium arcticum]